MEIHLLWYQSEFDTASPQEILNSLHVLSATGFLGSLSKVTFLVNNTATIEMFPEYSMLLGIENLTLEIHQNKNKYSSTDISNILGRESDEDEFLIPIAASSEVDIPALRRLLTLDFNENSNLILCASNTLSDDAKHVFGRPEMLLFPWLQMGYKIPDSNYLIKKDACIFEGNDVELANAFRKNLETIARTGGVEIAFYPSFEKLEDPLSRWKNRKIEWKNSGENLPDKKVLIIGSVGDYHHHKLYFTSLLDSASNETFSYRLLDERLVKQSDLYDSNLVLFSRLRGETFSKLLQNCLDLQVPTIYMLDDNWFSIGTDLPELYGKIFDSKGELLTRLSNDLRKVGTLVCYSQVLQKDLLPLNPKVELLKPSINVGYFESFSQVEENRNIYRIGFAGSLRFADSAFEGMARISKNRNDVELYIVGTISEAQKKLFNGISVKYVPFMAYEKYVQTVAEIGLDLMVAPLGVSRSEASKVVLKYLEITASGAVGLYSDVTPYKEIIVDGQNGFLVKQGATGEDWEKALNEALDSTLLQQINQSALADIKQHYSVESAYEDLKQIFSEVMSEEP